MAQFPGFGRQDFPVSDRKFPVRFAWDLLREHLISLRLRRSIRCLEPRPSNSRIQHGSGLYGALIELSLAADAAHDLLDRGVALEHREQTAVENRTHAIADRGPLDRSVVGALEDQTIDRPRRHQQLGDRPAPAKAGAATGGAAYRVIKRD